jgi:hypothetical protein
VTGSLIGAPRWALLGKRPGDKGDYHILRGTPGLTHDRAWSGVPSTPQLGGKPGPGRLPWVTFTPRAAADEPWMAVTVIDATDDRDAAGRPVVSIRYVELPFAELARDRACYLALYHAMPSVAAFRAAPGDEPVALRLDDAYAQAARALATDADAFDRAARIAALLLSDEVLIELGSADMMTLEARLAQFDQVLALLPYGVRASAALASWHDGTQPTAFRLAYGEFAFRGQSAVGRVGRVPRPRDPAADAYLRALLSLVAADGIEAVCDQLSLHRWPPTPHADAGHAMALAEEAAGILRELADPELLVAAILDGRATVGRVAAVRELAAGRLDRTARDQLERYLLAQDGGIAAQSVLSGWSDRTAKLGADVVLAELAVSEHSPAAGRLRGYAVAKGEEERFLAALVGRARSGSLVPPERIAACLDELPPRVGELPILRGTVVDWPGLGRAVLFRALRDDSDPEGWLGWLDPLALGVPSWLRRYGVLAGAHADASLPLPDNATELPPAHSAIEDLALIAWFAGRTWSLMCLADEWWPRLFALARPRLPTAGATDAARRAGSQDADRAGEILAELVRAPLGSQRTAAGDVRSDTLRLYCGVPPACYPATGRAADARRYLDALRAVWSAPPPAEDADTLTALLLTGVFRGTEEFPRAAPDGEPALVLLRAAVGDGTELSGVVADAIAEALRAAPQLYTDPGLSGHWWASVERIRPDLRTPTVRLQATLGDPGADPADVAVLIGRAAVASQDYAEIADIARNWVAQYPVAKQRGILRIIQGVVELAADDERGGEFDDVPRLAALLGLPKDRSPSASFLSRNRRSS